MIYDILLKAVLNSNPKFLLPHEKETRQQFLRRFTNEICEINMRAWNKLPETAQRWNSDAVEAINTGKPIPPIPGEEEMLPPPPPLALPAPDTIH
jgi:hypothetical protein